MANLDELKIKITASSKEADEAIKTLTSSLNNLNEALGNLDTSKVNSFASAMSKLSNIGANTNTTSKALRGMSTQIQKAFNIKTKEGIQEVNRALNDFYESTKNSRVDSSLPTQKMYTDNARALYKAIKDNAAYRKEISDDAKKIKNVYDTAQSEGLKYSLKGIKDAFPSSDDFEKTRKELGLIFSMKGFSGEKGLQSVDSLFDKLYNDTKNPVFFGDKDNVYQYKEGLETIAAALNEVKEAKESLTYDQAKGAKIVRGDEVKGQVLDTAEQLKVLVRQQAELGAENGLSGIVNAFKTLSYIKVPDLSGVADAVKTINANPPMRTAKAVSDIGDAASRATSQVQTLNDALGKSNKNDLNGASFRKDIVRADDVESFGFKSDIQGLEAVDYAFKEIQADVEKLLPAVITVKDNIRQLFESDLGIDKATQEIAAFYSKLSEPPLGLPMFDKMLPAVGHFEKMLPAVVQTQSATDRLFSSIEDVVNDGVKVDAVTQSFYDWKTQALEAARAMEQAGASFEKWRIPEQGVNPSFARESLGWVSDIKPEVVEGYFYNIEDAANKCLPAIQNIGTTALALPDQFKVSTDYINQCLETMKTDAEGATQAIPKTFNKVEEGAKRAASEIEKATQAAREYKRVISDMESGKIDFNKDIYDNAVKGYNKATEAIKNYKNELLGVGKKTNNEKEKPTAMADVLENVVALGEALENLSGKLNAAGDKGIKLFKILTTPLKMATEEYAEKFKHMGDVVKGFQQNFKAHMAKISQFWKRTMKTFTFMLVRKAITAIIKEVGNAVQSLAMYSNAMGTAFNTDISLMVADFQYLGRSIVSVFAPLLSYIAPIIDAIVDKIATLISYIGMLIAALGGSTSFTKAKKNVGNYADSLDQASKSAKNLTMGIDELNILSEGGGGGGAKPYDGWEDAWEDVEIPKWITDLADKIKKMWDDFIRPIKAAWDKVKEYFKFAFNYMKDQVGKLAKSIWDAFIQVWNEPETIEMIANIFRIIADLMIVIGNLAKNFREAWDEVVDGASRGVQIFRGIRDIFAVLIEHVRNVTWYMVRWSSELNFRPLLDSIITLLHSLYDLADFLGGVFEDIMKNVVLRYIKWLIEEGIPHLNRTIAEVIDAFDFDKIRQDLVPVEDAFERLLEHIEEGTTNAMGNLGKQIAEFANSQEFTDFMQRIADIMDLLSAEDVEKILTGIGQGILSIAESVVKFINSDAFMSFLEGLDKWLENASSEDIAGILKGVATAIGIFKFGAFVGEGLAGFFKFATVLVSLKNLHEIASGLTAIGAGGSAAGAGATAASGGFAAIAGTAGIVVAIIAAVIAGVYSLTTSFGGLTGLLDRLKESADRVINTFKNVASALKLDEIIQRLKDRFQTLIDKLGDMKDYWNLVIGRIEFLAHILAAVLVPAIEVVIVAFTAVIDIITGVIDVIAGLGTAITGVVEGITTGDWSKVEEGFSRIGDGLVESFVMPFADVADGINKAVVGGVEGIGKVIFGEVDKDIRTADWEKIPAAETVGKGTATGISNAYKSAAASTETTMKETTKTMLSNGLGVAGEVDYVPTATTYNQKLLENLCSSADTIDWASYGTLVNTKTGEELVNQSQPFDTANVTTATTGAETFTSTYADYFNNDTTIQNALEQYGAESGKKLSDGFNTSVTNGNDATTSALLGWFGSIKGTVDRQLDQVKALFQNKFNSIFTELDVTASITTVFTNITNAVTTNMNALGENLLGTLLPSFMETYIFPFFNLEMWQPLFDNLMNVVFLPFFEQFRVWFMEEAMTPWWEEDLLSWFADDKWNEEIFMPLHENIQENWDLFSSWWDTTMNAWWEDQVLPWFDKPRWEEQFNKILEVVKKVFDLIKQAIKLRIDEAKNAVLEACEEMKNAIEEVMTAIDTMMEKLSGFEGFNGDVTFSFGAKEFASGGFPAYGSLFVAGEPGAGTEWVGNVGGRTGVVSNNEITGIADAVYATGNTESELLSQLLNIGRAMLEKDPVVLSDREIARMANRGQSQLGMSIIS